jgi:hypothetical protein
MRLPALGEGGVIYGGAEGRPPRGQQDRMLREPAWPLRADPLEAKKADYLRDEIKNINNPKDYDWAIHELQGNKTLAPEERSYLDELAKYTSGQASDLNAALGFLRDLWYPSAFNWAPFARLWLASRFLLGASRRFEFK